MTASPRRVRCVSGRCGASRRIASSTAAGYSTARDGAPLVPKRAPKVVESLPPDRHRAHDLHSEHLGEQIAIDLHPQLARLVGHVEIEREGDSHLGELRRDEERATQVLGVGDLHHGLGGLIEEDIAGDPLVLRHRHQTVHARGVDDLRGLAVNPGLAPSHGDGGARIVGDGDVATGEKSEDDALADVGIADQHDAPRPARRVGGREPGQDPKLQEWVR